MCVCALVHVCVMTEGSVLTSLCWTETRSIKEPQNKTLRGASGAIVLLVSCVMEITVYDPMKDGFGRFTGKLHTFSPVRSLEPIGIWGFSAGLKF